MHEALCYSPNMLAESLIVPQCSAEPRSLGGLMALYESNFIKLCEIAPLLSGAGTRPAGYSRVSSSARDLDLHLAVDAVTRYTMDLRLTYLFPDEDRLVRDPDLHLRIYLDARMVEVVSWSVSRRHAILRDLLAATGRELDRRWARNIMLGKWLDYLRDMQHNFPVSVTR